MEKTKLDLSYLKEEADGGLPKEGSFVGDLISFGDINTQRKSDVRRRSDSLSSDSDGLGRRQSLQKTFSERDLRRVSLSRSPIKGRRKSIDIVHDSPDGDSNARGRTTRRESMMNALRHDLEKVPCLEAIQKRHTNRQESNDSDQIFEHSDSDRESVSPTRTGRRLTHRRSTFRADSQISGVSLSSYESLSVSLTENEVRKLKMLQTLAIMGDGKGQKKQSVDLGTTESAILEASFLRGKKRGSIATHVLMTARKRQEAMGPKDPSKPNVVIGKSFDPPTPRSESEVIADELKERANRLFNIMKGPDYKPKLPSLFGSKEKDPTAKEDAAKDALLGFRRKIRRKKVGIVGNKWVMLCENDVKCICKQYRYSSYCTESAC